jgi:hypothetical protein
MRYGGPTSGGILLPLAAKIARMNRLETVMIRLSRVVALSVLVIGFSAACGDNTFTSAPVRLGVPAESHADAIPSTLIARAAIVHRTQTLSEWEYVCDVVTPTMSGGSMSLTLRKAGLKVHFYDGAVDTPQKVCIVAHPGALLTYSFYPHGLQFKNNIKVQQDLKGTTAWKNATIMSSMMGGYMPNGVENDVDANGVGSFAQVFEVYYSDDSDTFTKTTPALVKFYTNHFSGYALASGRSMRIAEEIE